MPAEHRRRHRTLALIAFIALSCLAQKWSSATELASLRGAVSLRASGAPPTGNLIVYWMSPSEVRQEEHGGTQWSFTSMRAIRSLLLRAVPFASIDFARTPKIDFHFDAPPDAIVFALLDTHHQGVSALLDGASRGDWFGVAQRDASRLGRADVFLSPVATTAVSKEQCSGPRDRLEVIDAPEVAGSIGNDTKRRLCVHLPVDYEASRERRYPVVYVLPGYSGNDSGGSVALVFRAGDERPVDRQTIFVGVNIATKHGASYLVASPLSGDFDKFLSTTVPAFIDQHYRTIARAAARGLIGQSTGGFGVVSLALRHSDRFGVVAESSADGLDLASWMLEPDGRHVTSFARSLLRLEDTLGPPGQMASYAADWSPDAKAHWGYRWPANPSSGEIVDEVWRRWLSHSPSELIKEPSILASARAHLSGKIYLAVGIADDFDLYPPAKRFSEELLAAGVANQLATDGEDHGGTIARKRGLVAFTLDRLEHDPPRAAPQRGRR